MARLIVDFKGDDEEAKTLKEILQDNIKVSVLGADGGEGEEGEEGEEGGEGEEGDEFSDESTGDELGEELATRIINMYICLVIGVIPDEETIEGMKRAI